MPCEHPRHRHALLLPLLLLCVSVPTVLAVVGSASQEQPSVSPDVVFSVDGAAVIPHDQARISDVNAVPRLEHGSVTVYGDGIVRLWIGSGTDLLGVNGACSVSRYGDAVAIAALTTPVLVRHENERLLIPVRMQWQSSLSQSLPSGTYGLSTALDPVPERFFFEQLQLLQNVPQGVVELDVLPPARQAAPRKPLLASLLLPGAAEQSQATYERAVLGAVRASTEAGSTADLQSLLTEYGSEVFLNGAFWSRSVLALLAAQAPNAGVRAPLIAALVQDPDLWLLLSQHPVYSAYTWLFGAVPASLSHALTGGFLLPISARTFPSMAPGSVQQWQRHMGVLLMELKEAPVAAAALLWSTDEALGQLQAAGYPERAAQFAAALVEIVSPYERELPPRSAEVLASLRAWDHVGIDAFPIPEQAVPEAPVRSVTVDRAGEAGTFSADAVVHETQQALVEAGALFTVETSVRALSASTARVEGIVFSTKERDRYFDFTYDLSTRTVSAIVEEGTQYLHTVPIDAFRAWVFTE